MQSTTIFLLLIGLAVNILLTLRLMVLMKEARSKFEPQPQVEVEAVLEPDEEVFRDNVPPPWVTRAIKQSNDWADPQDRGDELAALREKMRLSRHMS